MSGAARGVSAPPGRPHGRTWYLLLGVGALGLGLLLLRPLPPGIWHDDAVYLLLGRALAEGEGLRYVGVPGSWSAPKFPPVYPAVLSLLWRVSDNPYGVAQVAGVLNVAFLAASAVLVALWARRLGVSLLPAVGAALLVALSVELWQTAMVALSEPLFVLVALGALLAALRVERSGGLLPAVALSALLLIAVHVRTAGVPLLAASVLGLALARRWRESACVAVVTGVGVLPWTIWSNRATAELPAPLRDILGGYGGWLGERVLADPGAYLSSLGPNLLQNAVRLLALFLPGAPTWLLWVLGPVVGILLVLGGFALGRRSPTAALALVLLFVEVWLWPFEATRLLLPIFPIASVAVSIGVDELSRWRAAWWRNRPLAPVVYAAGVAAFALGASQRMASGEVAARYYLRARTLAGGVDLIERFTPPDAVVGAPELWGAFPLVTGRRSAPSAPFRPDPTHRSLAGGTPAEQLAVWEAAQLEYLYLEHEGRVNGATLELLQRSCPGSVQLLGAAPGDVPGGNATRALIRLTGDPACRRALAVHSSPGHTP